MERRRFKQTPTLESRFDKLASRLRKAGRGIPPRVERADYLLRSRPTDTAADVDHWVSTPCASKDVRYRRIKATWNASVVAGDLLD